MSTQAEYSDGDKLYGIDLDNIVEALSKDGVLTGWTIAQNATPNMSVDVAAGTGFSGGVYNTTVSTSNIAITASHASLDRLDIIVVNNAGTISAIAGTPAASPNPPDLPDNNICLAIIEVDATVTAIYDADIISRRFLIGTIKKEMLYSQLLAEKNMAETITGNWTHQGMVNFQETIKLQAAKRIQLCFSGDTVIGEFYADSATSMRFTQNLVLGSAKSFKFGDGSDLLAELIATSGVFYIKDTGSNTRYRHTDGGNTQLQAPAGDIIFNPSGDVYIQSAIEIQGTLRSNTNQVVIGDHVHASADCSKSLGSADPAWANVYCGLLVDNLCSEYAEPQNAFEILSTLKDILPQGVKKGKIHSRNYPAPLRGWDKTKKIPMVKGRNLSAVIDYLIFAMGDIREELDQITERL